MGTSEYIYEQEFRKWLVGIKNALASLDSTDWNAWHAIIEEIFHRLEKSESEQEKISCLVLLEEINGRCEDARLLNMNLFRLQSLGYQAYQDKSFLLAETAFRLFALTDNITGKNNYAYMIRRGEVADSNKHKLFDAALLLRDGVKAEDPFSLVNYALALALYCGAEKDWKLADELVSLVSFSSVDSICSWWEEVAESGDPEGFLVHLWLLRHRKIESSPLGPKLELATRLSLKIPRFPHWMKQYASE